MSFWVTRPTPNIDSSSTNFVIQMLSNQCLEDETSSLPCNLCGNRRVSVLAFQCRNGKPLRSVICKLCGLIWSDPFPFDVRDFYADNYRLQYKKAYSPKPKHILRAGTIALTRYEKIKPLLTKSQTVLDVGTGGGEFAYLLKYLGHDLYGIEPNRGYAEYSIAEYGLNLHIGFIQDCRYHNESFDLITIWHVLEHTENPLLVLQKLHNLLKPDGTLVVEVPNIEAICQAPKNTFHIAHLFNFNKRTLAKLGEKAGFKIDEQVLSTDSGNLTIFFRKNFDGKCTADNWHIVNNAKQIATIIHEHTTLKHYLTITPYLRFLYRMNRSLSEKMIANRFNSNKNMLDHLYRQLGKNGEN